MDNVISHPRFDRPPVAQPLPRLRRGTINLRKARARRRMMAQEPRLPVSSSWSAIAALPTGRDWVQIAVDGDINAFRLFKALQSEGLSLRGRTIVEDDAGGAS